MGLVYLAHDRRTGLPVAIKVMSRWSVDPELQARFLKENRILSSLNHRNIVRCYEITESREGTPSIVMEYVDGVDFRAFEGRPYPELLPLMIQALMGLAYLRSQNILHRDLSSNNIFVTLENQTRVTKILDFGVAKILQQQAVDGDVKTRTGQFLGKFSFASPEHFRASTVDWRSDVYSLGVIFHRLLTQTPPITVARKSNYYDWMMAHQKDPVFEVLPPPGVPPLPDPLRAVVRQMLARNPDDRPQSYEEIIHVLDRIQRGLPSALEPDPFDLRTLPPPVEGRIGSSGSGKRLSIPSSPARAPAAWSNPVAPEAESPSVDESQQKRWPELDVREPQHTERFVPPPSLGVPEIPGETDFPAEPSPPDDSAGWEPPFGASPARTELLPPPASADAMKTATTVTSGRPDGIPEVPVWSGGAATDAPAGAAGSSSSRLLEEKTERLDDVIEKLRQQALLEPLPPLKLAPTPEAPPVAPPVPSRPGRRLVVYGEAPPAVVAPRAAARPAPPEAPAPAPAASGRRFRGIGITLIVSAIVVLFGAILWVLISVLK